MLISQTTFSGPFRKEPWGQHLDLYAKPFMDYAGHRAEKIPVDPVGLHVAGLAMFVHCGISERQSSQGFVALKSGPRRNHVFPFLQGRHSKPSHAFEGSREGPSLMVLRRHLALCGSWWVQSIDSPPASTLTAHPWLLKAGSHGRGTHKEYPKSL